MPTPSAPIKRDKTTRYKNPSARSAIFSPVTTDAFSINEFFLRFFMLYCTSYPTKICHRTSGKKHIVQYMLTLKRPQFYKVKAGQTLQEIADNFHLPVTLIIKENALRQPPQAGEILYLPNVKGNLYTVQAGDSKRLLCGSDENYKNRNGTDILYPTMRVFL